MRWKHKTLAFICEKLVERSLDGSNWTRMKLPTRLGGTDIRAVTSQLGFSFDITVKKTRKQAERVETNLTGKRGDCADWVLQRDVGEMWDGSWSTVLHLPPAAP